MDTGNFTDILGKAGTARSPRESADATHLKTPLPEDPMVVIQADHSWTGLELGDFWTYRELLYFLVWRELKLRYKQTLLGAAWIIMQPVAMTLIFTIFLGMLARVPTDGIPYPLLAFSGLLPWTFFSSAVTGCSYSLVGNANLITKVFFPRVLLPASCVIARLVDFVVSFAIIIVLLVFYRVVMHYHFVLSWKLAILPPITALMVMAAFGFGMLIAALNVKYRDAGVILPVLIQLGMFSSPVLYPTSLIPQRWRLIYFLNPLAGLIAGFRSALLGGQLDFVGLAISAIFIVLLLISAVYIFRRIEKTFADVI